MRTLLRFLLLLALAALSYRLVGEVMDRRHGSVDYGAPDYGSWLADARGYSAAREQQSRDGGPILLYFYADWCGFCKRLGREVIAAPEVREFLDGVTRVRINPEHGIQEEALASRYHVTGYPTLLVLSPGQERPRTISTFYQARDGHVHAIPPKQFIQEVSDDSLR